ncbi:MAG: hypothetical protein PHN66_03830 [Candidatus Shapirobacteria bacterium]|nr:hypothetical protein [Candidatus Shapirobacteria bacterium]
MSKFKKFFFPLLLVVTTTLICFLNYTPGTFLTGWDTLHPEFNFSLNFKRLIFGIWHSEQGLGAIPGHAQMADLPRVIILYLFHFVLPLNFLRYSYIFLCLTLGPLGIYFLIKNIFQKNHQQNLVAFITALFYIFNLSTVQQFYVPFEMFPTQWAFLPWIILFSLKYLKKPSTFNLIGFSLFTLLATPQAYAAQLWYGFFIIFLTFIFLYSFLHKNFKSGLKLIVFTLLLNAFWLIPNIFYIITSSDAPKINHDNRLYSQEYLLKNRADGHLKESTLVKGFYFDWSVYNFQTSNFENLMLQWNQHIENPFVSMIGYTLFIISLIGLTLTFVKKNHLFISFSPFFIIPFILLSNRVPIFSQLFDFLIQNSTIKESFRFIFTKLSTLFIFGIIIFFSYSLNLIFQKIKTIKFIISSFVLLIIVLIIYAFPIFQGYLISPKVKINIPKEYFQMWQFMKTQDGGRILSLPLNQSSGWQYYDWGYQGSGFLWFNLKQDLLDRDSDRWNDKNEQSYKEFFNSLYSQDPNYFYKTLNKYQIKYIIWDQNMITYSEKNLNQITFKKETEDLFVQLENKSLIKKINQFDSIYVYQTNISSPYSEIKTVTNFVQPSYQWGYFDAVNSSNYITNNTSNLYFPFRDLLDKNQKIDPKKIEINQLTDNQWQINLKTNDQLFNIPTINSTEKIIPTGVYLIKNQNRLTLKFEFPIPKDLSNSLKTEFDFPLNISQIKINDIIFPININLLSNQNYLGIVNIFVNSDNFLNDKTIDFNFAQQTPVLLKKITFNSNSFNFNDRKYFKNNNDNKNYTLELPKITHASGYILGIKNKYFSGVPLRICFRNNYSFLCSIEDELNKNKNPSWDYFLVPSTGNNYGYQLSITNYSYGDETSESLIEQITIIPIPFNLLSQIKYENQATPNNFAILNQSYSRFWVAFYFKNGQPIFLKNHVLANNWANAWEIPKEISSLNPTIHYLFWPQIFEFIGLGLTIFVLFKMRK